MLQSCIPSSQRSPPSLVNDTSTFNSNQLVVPQVKSQSADVELSLFIDLNTETRTFQLMLSSYVNRYEDHRQFCHIKNVCSQTNLQQLWRHLQVRTPKLWNFQRFQRLVKTFLFGCWDRGALCLTVKAAPLLLTPSCVTDRQSLCKNPDDDYRRDVMLPAEWRRRCLWCGTEADRYLHQRDKWPRCSRGWQCAPQCLRSHGNTKTMKTSHSLAASFDSARWNEITVDIDVYHTLCGGAN